MEELPVHASCAAVAGVGGNAGGIDGDGSGEAPVRAGPHARVPRVVWGAALAVALLRAIPFLAAVLTRPPLGAVAIPAAFVPKDWLAYAALVRQGWGPFANPFTTDPQEHRIVLLLHQALGAIHATTGIDPFWLLELSRIPLLLAFTWALWRFVERVHVEHRDRVWACLLVLLSGGVSFVARWMAPVLPERARTSVGQDLWTAYGWSTFDASFNPVWIAGLTLALVALRPLLQPGGPASRGDLATGAVAFAAAWLVHPYSAVAVFAATAGSLVSERISGERGARERLRRAGSALAPAAILLGALVLWQRGDPAFRAASGGFFGPQAASVAWYPLTLGAVGFFALRGLRGWAERGHPWRHGLVGWVGAVALLHSSNVVNGYHFVFALHLPVALLAAPAVAEWFEARRARGPRGVVARAAVAGLLFASPLATTGIDTGGQPRVSGDVARLVESLGTFPPGNVLAPPGLGNLVPAYGPHRVFAGHWFMTPNYQERAALAEKLTSDPGRAPELCALVTRERIDYVIVPAWMQPALDAAGLRITRVSEFGALVVLTAARP